MDMQAEKKLLLQGIKTLSEELDKDNFTLDTMKRYQQLVHCLLILNWRECGVREGEGSHIQS